MKKFIRRVAALGAGTSMLFGAVGGALAAGETLADLPKPFVVNGVYDDVAMVVGSKAAGNDDAARTTVKSWFDGFATKTSAGSVVSSSDTEKLFPGENLTQEFTTNQLEDGQISSLWDGGIDFRGGNYETHEEVFVGGSGAGLGDAVYVVTSGLTGEEELGPDYKLYTTGSNVSWGYRYEFDEDWSDADAINNSKELTISFLGKEIRISDVVASNDKVTITTGDQSSRGMDESFEVAGHTIHIGTIFETKVEVWVDNENHKFMDEGDIETFNIGADQVEVKVDDIGYTDDVSSRTILVTTGENIETAVKDGDAVQKELDEPDVDDDASEALFNWDIQASKDDHFNKTDYIGIEWNQRVSKYDDDPLPIGPGEYWSTPYGYITLDLEFNEPGYAEFIVAMEKNYDINATHEQDVLLFTAVGRADSNDGLRLGTTETNRVACNGTGYCFYEDNEGDFQAGALANSSTTCNTAHTLCFEPTSDSTKSVRFVNGTGVTQAIENGTVGYIVIQDLEDADDNLYSGSNITFNVSIANSRFGATAATDEAGDLYYLPVATPHGAVTAAKEVQAWDEGVVRTMYGMIISGTSGMTDGDIESAIEDDRFHLWIPDDEVFAEVTFNVRSSGTATEAVLTTESGAGAYDNLILVGGPCVNSLTAEWMGLSYPSCGTSSGITENRAVIEIMESGGKSALIVAGWEKADTQRAAGKLSGLPAQKSYIVT